jgi:hypothetical protein
MRLQVVHHHSHPLGFRKAFLDEPSHLVCELFDGALRGDGEMRPTSLRLAQDEQVADPWRASS